MTENYELSVRSHSGLPPSNRQPMDSYIFYVFIIIIINIFFNNPFHSDTVQHRRRKKKSGDIYITLCL